MIDPGGARSTLRVLDSMQSTKLIIRGGCGLAFGAAFVNAGLLLKTGTSVSHLTGDVTRMTIDLAQWSSSMLPDLSRVGMAALGFLLGAILAGAVINHPTLDISRPYGRSITFIGLLFLGAAALAGTVPLWSIGLAAFACGFQNSLATHFRGLVLRTTHLTGLMTDLGVNLGMRLRGHNIPVWKIMIPFFLLVSFAFGGLIAAMLYFSGFDVIFFSGVGYIISGLAWSVWKRCCRCDLRA